MYLKRHRSLLNGTPDFGVESLMMMAFISQNFSPHHDTGMVTLAWTPELNCICVHFVYQYLKLL
jgi:hypothetical protein